jgi:hypothetical protein
MLVAEGDTARVDGAGLGGDELAGAVRVADLVLGVVAGDAGLVEADVVEQVVAELEGEELGLLVDEGVADTRVDLEAEGEALELVVAPLDHGEQGDVAEEVVVAGQSLDVAHGLLGDLAVLGGRLGVVPGERRPELLVVAAEAELGRGGEGQQPGVSGGLEAAR